MRERNICRVYKIELWLHM